MKKIIFIISITLFAFNSQAQGTLQFNQVITIAHDTTVSISEHNSPGIIVIHNWNVYTVPADKVAKLVKLDNILINTYANNGYNTFNFTLNDVIIDQDKLSGVWLKAGSQLKANAVQEIIGGYPNQSTCNQSPQTFLSLIEYNIIPE